MSIPDSADNQSSSAGSNRRGVASDDTSVNCETVREHHLSSHGALSRSEYPEADLVCREDHLRWKHCENPSGPSISYETHDAQGLCGRALLQPRAFTRGDQKIIARQLVDLLIRPERRDLGHFLRIARAALSDSSSPMIYFVPNRSSGPLFRAVLPHQHFALWVKGFPLNPSACIGSGRGLASLVAGKGSPLGWLLRPLITLPVLAMAKALAAISRINAHEELPSPEELSLLTGRLSEGGVTIGERTREFYQWRLAPRSGRSYHLHTFRRADRSILGQAVLRHFIHRGLPVTVLIDLLLHSAISPLERYTILFSLLAQAHRAGSAAVIWLGSERASEGIGAPFFSLPPQTLGWMPELFVHAPTQGASELTSPLWITLLDLDIF